MRSARVTILAIVAAAFSTGALAANDAPGDPTPPAATSDTEGEKLDDNKTIVAPWERENAGEPSPGADDDPTPFDPAEGPQDPLEN